MWMLWSTYIILINVVNYTHYSYNYSFLFVFHWIQNERFNNV
jgi:hypothetical protein